MTVGEFSSLELCVGAKMKKSSRIEERVAPAQEEWQQIIAKKTYIYFKLVRPTIWHENTKKAIPGSEPDNACMPAKLERHTNREIFSC